MSWSRESRHKRGYGSRWDRLRLQVLKRDRWLCQACLAQGKITALGIRRRDHAVDHIVPKAHGGSDDLPNLQSLCTACHEAKTARDEGRKRLREVGLDGYPV